MKAYGAVNVQTHVFLTSVLGWDEWSASRPGHGTPKKIAPVIHWIWRWVDLRAGLEDVEKWKFLTPPGLELRLLCC
jgi:hypothetical protein